MTGSKKGWLILAQKWIQFLRYGSDSTTLGGEWQLAAYVDQQLKFLPEITAFAPCPDIVLWSIPARLVIMVELTVTWEEMEAAYERKKKRHTATCLQAEGRAFTFPVKVGCRGFFRTSTPRLLKTLGIRGLKKKQTLQGYGRGGRKGKLLAQRKDKVWEKKYPKKAEASGREASTTAPTS